MTREELVKDIIKALEYIRYGSVQIYIERNKITQVKTTFTREFVEAEPE